jgi:DNA repair photolyase
MSVTKAVGNMYPWVTHCHSFLRGECPHKCEYCYAKLPVRGHASRQVGPLKIDWQELEEKIPSSSVVFREHKNDLFADGVPEQWIESALERAGRDTTRGIVNVWQTKNPARYLPFTEYMREGDMVGTTLETNRETSYMSVAPSPVWRAKAMREIAPHLFTFVTIEPILKFDVAPFVKMIRDCRPFFVNIGADSKGHGLPEPTAEEIELLVRRLRAEGIDVRIKANLKRLAPDCV